MDRQKAVQYHKQKGFLSKSSGSRGQPRFISPNDMVVAGDGMGQGPKDETWRNAESFTGRNHQSSWQPPIEHEPLLLRSFQTPSPCPPPGPVTVCTACTCCISTPRIPEHYSQTPGTSGSTFSLKTPGPVAVTDIDTVGYQGGGESDSDEEEGLSFDKLLTVMLRISTKPSSTAISTTLLRLASCFNPAQSLTESQINQLMEFLLRPQITLKEAAFRILERLLDTGWGRMLVSQSQLMDKVVSLMGAASPPCIQVLAMGVLDKMLNVPDLDYAKIRVRLEEEVYPCILRNLHSSAGLNVKYASCCLVRTLAHDADFAARIKEESLFLLRQLRDSSAMLREVYVGVLMAMFAHPGLTEAGSIDTGILPVIKGFLRDGPCDSQRQALELLHCVMSDERGIEAVTSDQLIMAFAMACLLTSNCRKVRAHASKAMAALTSLRRIAVARGVLMGISHYMHPHKTLEADVGGGSLARVTYPVLTKNMADTHMWHNLDCFLDSAAGLFRSEGLIVTESGSLYSALPLKGDIGMLQLSTLSHLLQVFINMCTWPMLRRVVGFGNAQPAKLDVTHLCEDLSLREKFTALNHRLAVQQWKRFGPSVFAILRWMSHRIRMHFDDHNPTSCENLSNLSLVPNISQASVTCSSPASTNEIPKLGQRRSSAMTSKETISSQASSAGKECRPTSGTAAASCWPSSPKSALVVAKEILGEAEWTLLHSLLNFLLSMALVSCKTILDPLTSDKVKDAGSKLGSFQSSSSVGSVTNAVKKKPQVSSAGLWVSENPHLLQMDGREGSVLKPEDIERKQLEEAEKEAERSRRLLRRGMYNEELFTLLSPLVQLADPEVKSMCNLILRAAVQPLEEKAPPSRCHSLTRESSADSKTYSYTSFGQSSSTADLSSNSPHSSLRARKSEKVIDIALHRMSPSSATVVKEALHARPQSAVRMKRSFSTGCSPKDAIRIRQISAAGTDSSQWSKSSGSSGRSDSPLDLDHQRSCPSTCQLKLRPLVPGQPINMECQRAAVEHCGSVVLQSLFTRWRSVKLYALRFLLDLTMHAPVEILMELSKHGVIPKLLDFLRISDQDEELTVLGLKVLKVLVETDVRLQQLFSHHAGHNLLMVLIKNPIANIRDQVRATLVSVTKGPKLKGRNVRGQRPASAPVKSRGNSARRDIVHPTDIWDHIMNRWAEEDQVVTVLQKFL